MKEGFRILESSPRAPLRRRIKGDGYTLKFGKLLLSISILILIASCRGQKFDQQPVHPNMNMDQQKRFEAQEENPYFADKRSMRHPVEGTIARGNLQNDPVFYEGINEDSSFVTEIPVEVDRSFLYRGQERYEVYCTPCHGKVGDGQGIIMTGGYGYVPAPSYHIDRIRNMPDGQLYSSIANGVRTMPSYAHQIKPGDRWAIVAYIRALQRSQNVPEDEIKEYDIDLVALQEAFSKEQAEQEAQQAAQQAAGSGVVSAEQGEKLVQTLCIACHSLDGSTGLAPTFQGLYGSERTLSDGSTVTADDGYIIESIQSPSEKIVEGYEPVMPSFRDITTEQEMESIIEFLKTLQ